MKITHNRFLKAGFVFYSCVFYSLVSAQVLPDAGSELQQDQLEIQRSLPNSIPSPIEPVETVFVPLEGDDTIHVNDYIFMGGFSIYEPEQLYNIVAEYVDQTLTITELNLIVNRVTLFYRSNGYLLARAILPPQDVTEGLIQIEVIEGRLDVDNSVEINGEELRVEEERIQNIFSSALESGGVIRSEELERAVLLVNDLPGVNSTANIESGGTPGTSRIVLDVREKKTLNSMLRLDNNGSRLTGEFQLTALFGLNNRFGFGEQIVTNFQESFGAGEHHYASAHVTVPVGYSGLTLGSTLQYLYYKAGKEFRSLHSKGSAFQWAIDANFPLIRRSRQNLWLNTGLEFKQLKDEALGVDTNHREIKEIKFGVLADQTDSFFTGGYTQASITAYFGNLDLSALNSSMLTDQSSVGANTNGKFSKLLLHIRRIQRGVGKIHFIADLRAQFASKNLSSSENIQLGGSSGVRAYPPGEATGGTGAIINLEGYYALRQGTPIGDINLSAFFDWGRIQQYKNSSNLLQDTANTYNLSGVGFSISAVKAEKFDFSFTLAHRIGRNPGRNIYTNKDTDGSLDETRLLLTMNMSF